MIELIQGDSLEELRKMADNSIDTVITDPPYGLSKHSEGVIRETLKRWLNGEEEYIPNGSGFMGKEWDSFVPPPALWKEVCRVMKPGGTILVFAGSRSQDLMAMSLRLAGFEIKDTLMWLYGSGFPKALDISKKIDKKFGAERDIVGKGKSGKTRKILNAALHPETFGGEFDVTVPATPEAKLWDGYKSHGLKPAYEPIIMAIKPNESSYGENALKWGVAGLNIDGGRIEPTEIDEYDLEKRPISKASNKNTNINLTGRYKDLRHGIQSKGRFPANVLLDEEAAKMLDEQSSASRFFYVTKASKKERNMGLDDSKQQNYHPTVKPLKLIEYLVRLTKMPNPDQVYLDPFLGSGTTGIACKNLGCNFIGIEIDEGYFRIANARINYDLLQTV